MTRPEFDQILEDAKKWRALKKELARLCTFDGNRNTLGAVIALVEKIEKEKVV